LRLVGVASTTLVLDVGLAPVYGSAQKPLPVSVEESRQLLQRGRVAEARAKLEAFLSQRPDSLEASTLLAQAYLLEDNYESATPLVLKGLKTHPMNSQLLATYGQCLFRQGDLLQAESQFRKSLTLNPKQASAHLGMGRILLSRLKSPEALQSLEQAMQFAPDLEDPYFFAGEAYGNTHNLKGQIQSLEKYISFDSLTHPERLQNAKALLQFFRSLEKEAVSEIDEQSRNYVFEVQPFFGLMLIEVRVNGEGPFRFLVDTGATSTVISNTLLSQLKITPIATSITRCVGGEGRIGSQLCKLSSLEIGDLKIKNVPVSSFDNAIFAELIDGVLSTSTLSDFLITLDYSDHRILLNPRPSSTGSPCKEGKAAAKLLGEFRIFGNLLLVAVSVNHQTSKNFLFDTGAVTSALSKKQASLLGVNEDTPDSRVDIQFAGACGVTKSVLSVNRVDLSSLGRSVKYAQILAVDLQEISKELETEVSGILGGDFFSHYKVTLDYYNTTIKLED
jgi:Tfp pilus assembly protein PilF/predicted aspartyl protease